MQINIINIMRDILLKLCLLCQMKTVECTTQALEFSMLLPHFTLLFQNYYTSLCTGHADIWLSLSLNISPCMKSVSVLFFWPRTIKVLPLRDKQWINIDNANTGILLKWKQNFRFPKKPHRLSSWNLDPNLRGSATEDKGLKMLSVWWLVLTTSLGGLCLYFPSTLCFIFNSVLIWMIK